MENTISTVATEVTNIKDFLKSAGTVNSEVKLTNKELVLEDALTVNYIKPIVTKDGKDGMIVKFVEKPNAYAFAPKCLQRMLTALVEKAGSPESAVSLIADVKFSFGYGEEFELNGETITPITVEVI